jgi:hypothetical protein
VSKPSPADELFREIREVGALLLQLVASPDTVDWHWPSYYQLYVQVDRMNWTLKAAARVAEQAPGIAGARPDAMTADAANAALTALGQNYMAILNCLWQLGRGMASRVNDAHLKAMLRAHLHPKSGWYQACITRYCAGRVSPDGARLDRTILLLEPHPPERIDQAVDETWLLRHQVFDIASDDGRRALALAAEDVLDAHARTSGAMCRHLLAHCDIADLAHPSSI